jgi:hypothetical protein
MTYFIDVSTIAGKLNAGSTNGIRSEATFNSPCQVAIDKLGNILIADCKNNMIRQINNQGVHMIC